MHTYMGHPISILNCVNPSLFKYPFKQSPRALGLGVYTVVWQFTLGRMSWQRFMQVMEVSKEPFEQEKDFWSPKCGLGRRATLSALSESRWALNPVGCRIRFSFLSLRIYRRIGQGCLKGLQ